MALDITFTVTIDSDRETVTIVDTTTFGGANPARSTLGVFLSAAKVAYDGTETDLTVTSDDSDPETDSEWSFPYTEGDGYYKIRYVAIPDFNTASTYAIYAAVFQPSTDKVYRSRANSNTEDTLTNTTWFEEITDPTSLADNKDEDNESTNIDSLVYERVLTANSQYEYGNLIAENCACTDCDDSEIINDYDLFSLWLNGAIKADERTEVLSGELLCRKIQSRFID